MNGDQRKDAKVSLCHNAARRLSKALMKDIKVAEQDIGNACLMYNQEYEKKLGRPTIQEFDDAITEFSKLPRDKIEKLIQEGREHAKKQKEMLKQMR
jgi:hypothetical protein